MLEYVTGGDFYDTVQDLEGMGEKSGRYFMNQLVDMMSYLKKKNVAHRDLKLENILIDENLQLKVSDFGFSTYKNVETLDTYLGTKTYMAPEIIELKEYDGFKADVFSLGVILFIMIQGTFPFSQAKADEYYFKYLVKGQTEKYFNKVGATNLSDNLKDLLIKMFSYNPANRPSIEEIKEHPWMQEKFDTKKALT